MAYGSRKIALHSVPVGTYIKKTDKGPVRKAVLTGTKIAHRRESKRKRKRGERGEK